MIGKSEILEGLNASQREAVLHIDGPMLTLAGPGSGKTRVVTHRIAHLISEGVSPYSILALTFTNKAAAEMRKRLFRMVGENPIWMGTFHGYCARFLRRFGSYIGLPPNYSIYDPSDAKQAMVEAVRLAGVSLSHLSMDQIIREISNWKNRLVTPDALPTETTDHNTHILTRVYPVYQQVLLKCGAVDFDDLLMHTAVLLRTHPELRAQLDESHKYILVDEYQDTNLAQYVMVRALSQDYPNINVTGDPDQSIYGWRGANIGNILNFEKDFPQTKIVRLEQNYRSTPQILSSADYLIQHNSRRKAKTLIPTRDNGDPIRLCIYPTDREEANHIADQIARQIVEEGKRASDFAILYRTNAQSRLLELALTSRRIGYQLIGGFRFYQRQEIKDLLAYLTLVQNPTDDLAFLRVVNTPTRGLGEKGLEKVRNLADQRGLAMLAALRHAIPHGLLSPKATKGAAAFLKLYDELCELASGTIVEMLKHLLKETDYVNYLQQKKTDAPDNSVQENVNELLADAAQLDLTIQDGSALEAFLEQVSLVSDTDSWEATNDRVTLMTLHSCKGLEFPSVYIIAIEYNILPHVRTQYDPQQIEEERRLFFVGITRAKDHLQLSMAHSRGMSRNIMGASSQFLMELPRNEIVRQDFTEQPDFEDADRWDEDFAVDRSQHRSRRVNIDEEEGVWSSSDQDEYSQLPPDEVTAQIQKMIRERKKSTIPQLRRGSDVEAPAAPEIPFRAGLQVLHPEYGEGHVLSVHGTGAKRLARIRFQDTGEIKSIFVAKSKLTILDS